MTAGHTGLPWPDLDEARPSSLLQTLRTRGRRPGIGAAGPSRIVLPVPGDVRGLAAGTQFEHDALAAGEAVIVAGRSAGPAIGLVPDSTTATDESDDDDEPEPRALVWTVYSLPGVPLADHLDLARPSTRCGPRCAQPPTRSAPSVRPAVSTSPTRAAGRAAAGIRPAHRAPDDAPSRALRVLENAAHVDAILAVSSD